MSGNRLNENLLKSLLLQAEAGHVPHACLFSGEDREASLRIAMAFAKALTDSAADVICVGHEKPGLFSVNDVRDGINSSVHIRPYGNLRKVYVIPDADLMNVQAQNALLKTLEEPPAYVVMLLLAENSDVFLETILSRCVKLRVQAEHARTEEAEGEEQDLRAKVREFLSGAGNADERELLAFTAAAGKDKLYAGELPEWFRQWFRDVLVYKTGQDASLLNRPEELSVIRELASRMSFAGIEKVLKAADELKKRLDANVNTELSFELFLRTIQDEARR